MVYLLIRATSVISLLLSAILVIGSFADDNLDMLRWSVAMSVLSTFTGGLAINSDIGDITDELDELYKKEEE